MKTICIILAIHAVLGANVNHDASALNVVGNEQAANVKPPKGIKTVTHNKEKNGGYLKGSPLYNKQEGIDDKDSDKKKHKQHSDKDKQHSDKDKHHAAAQAAVKDTQSTIGFMPKTMNFWDYLASMSVYAVFVLAFAYLHHVRMAPTVLGARTKGEAPKKHPSWLKCGFAYSFFDFGNLNTDWQICLVSWCCPLIQWASTASRSGVPFMSYWKAIALLLTLVLLAPITYGLTGLIILGLMFKRRRELRKVYNHSESNSMVQDVVLVLCCQSLLCCQLVQEAREVEYSSPKEDAPIFMQSAYPKLAESAA